MEEEKCAGVRLKSRNTSHLLTVEQTPAVPLRGKEVVSLVSTRSMAVPLVPVDYMKHISQPAPRSWLEYYQS